MKKKLVFLTGAGVSAESGIRTFRDADGLWENHRIEDVATPQAWWRNPELVLDFYNQRRRQAKECQPNEAHEIIAELEADFDITVVTQNVDDLHERAGSSHVVHLHGLLEEARSEKNHQLIYKLDGKDIHLGDLATDGHQLRPNIVWFGEEVPQMEPATYEIASADICVVVGTSLQVYPAAGLVNVVAKENNVYVIDPNKPDFPFRKNIIFITEKATIGMKILKKMLAEIN